MKMTLERYINKRLDGVQGEIPRLKHMLKKSLTSSNFRTFWVYWNPIYSYILTFYVYKPLRKIMGQGLARTTTFIVNGIFHDVIVSLLIGRLFYGVTLLFAIYIAILNIEEKFKVSISSMKMRIMYNLVLLLGPFLFVMNLIQLLKK